MFGIFVHDDGCLRFADLLAHAIKTIETRSRNTLKSMVGNRVAVIRTRSGRDPEIVGYLTITGSWFCPVDQFDEFYEQHLVRPGSAYYPSEISSGKWFYFCEDAEPCKPYKLPKEATTYHGRAWCFFEAEAI